MCNISWDNNEVDIPITAPTIVDPGTCTDAGNIVQYFITYPSGPEFEHLFVSVDGSNVKIYPKSGTSDTGVYTFTLNA